MFAQLFMEENEVRLAIDQDLKMFNAGYNRMQKKKQNFDDP